MEILTKSFNGLNNDSFSIHSHPSKNLSYNLRSSQESPPSSNYETLSSRRKISSRFNDEALLPSKISCSSNRTKRGHIYDFSSLERNVSTCRLPNNYSPPFDSSQQTSPFVGYSTPINKFSAQEMPQKYNVQKGRAAADSALIESRENIRNDNTAASILERCSNYNVHPNSRKNCELFVTQATKNWESPCSQSTTSIRYLLPPFPDSENLPASILPSKSKCSSINSTSRINTEIEENFSGIPTDSEGRKSINDSELYNSNSQRSQLTEYGCCNRSINVLPESSNKHKKLQKISDVHVYEVTPSNCQSFFSSNRRDEDDHITGLFERSIDIRKFRKKQSATVIFIGLFLIIFGLIFTTVGVCGLNLVNGIIAPISDLHHILHKHFYKGGKRIVFAVILWGLFFSFIGISLFYWAFKIYDRKTHSQASRRNKSKPGHRTPLNGKSKAKESNSSSTESGIVAVNFNDSPVGKSLLLNECMETTSEIFNVCQSERSDNRIVERNSNYCNGIQHRLLDSCQTSIPLVRVIV